MQIEVEDLPLEQVQNSKTPIPQDSIEHLSIANYFNVENPTQEEQKKLREIWNMGLGISQSREIPDVVWEIMHLTRSLGAPRLGEKMIDKVYRWAKLKRQEAEIQAELRNV